MNEYRPLGIGIDTAINLLGEVFGVHYLIPGDEKNAGQGVYPGAKYVKPDIYSDTDGQRRYSQFETPVIGDFWAVPDDFQYKIYLGGKLVETDFTEFEFPLASIVDFSKAKNIIKTPTIGSGGTVKEMFGFEDWKINIRGVIIDDPSRQAQRTITEQVSSLRRLNEIAGAIKVAGKIFEQKYIDHIVIENFTLSSVQGKNGMMQYEMECCSDEPFLLT